jgi:hypothetical protein
MEDRPRTDLIAVPRCTAPSSAAGTSRERRENQCRRRSWQLGFTGPVIPGGQPPTSRQLDAFLDVLPAAEAWTVHVRDGDGMSMAAHAILRGGHISIGLGDDPYERFAYPTNAELVQRVAEIARTVGRPLATTEQARRHHGALGIPLSEVSAVTARRRARRTSSLNQLLARLKVS